MKLIQYVVLRINDHVYHFVMSVAELRLSFLLRGTPSEGLKDNQTATERSKTSRQRSQRARRCEATDEVKRQTKHYSLDTVFIGFVLAALIEMKLIVMRATVRVIKSDTINGITVAHTNGDNPKSIW
jgi:hypothetical protein